MTRYNCYIEDGTVYVSADVGNIEVGPIDDVYRRFGQEYEVTYSDFDKERYDISFADEGLVMDVEQTLEAMTLNEMMVENVKCKPIDADAESFFESGRMALFTAYLSYDLSHGPK